MNNIIYDIESYTNFFSLAALEHETGQRWTFEISTRRNDYNNLVLWIWLLQKCGHRMVGFNNLSFDYPVLHAVLTVPGLHPDEIHTIVQKFINVDHSRRFDHIIWDKDQLVPQVDLYKIHHFDNPAKSTSLKILQFNMRSPNVQELPYHPDTILTYSQMDEVLDYNHHDVDETAAFYVHSLEQIRFRDELSVKYGHNYINFNDTKIGKHYFAAELEKKIPGCCWIPGKRKQPRQTHRKQIALKDVIFPWIKFTRPEFQRTLDWLNAKVITETKGVLKKPRKKELDEPDLLVPHMPKCEVNGFQFVFGTGGIHGSLKNTIVRSNDEYVIKDVDVASYYPNLAIKNRLYPEHLSEQFCDIYLDVYNQRKGYKKGSPENAMLKLALNGVYGDSNNVYSPFFDPQYTMAITINGQLLLCLLADYLMYIPGLQMIQVNTDGLTVRVPRVNEHRVTEITQWWEQHTLLELETVEYKAMYMRDVNSYIGEYSDGKLKRKGAYEYKLEWHKNHSALVIPRAAEAALLHGVPVRDFIHEHDDLFDFMLRAKVPRTSRLMLGDTQVQNICRYYISKTGQPLVKVMPPLPKKPGVERRIGIAVGWNCAECNNISKAVGSDIDLRYYIQEAEKLVNPLKEG